MNKIPRLLSKETNTLVGEDRARYIASLDVLNIDCPYGIPDSMWSKGRASIQLIPNITWPKIVHFFQNRKSSFNDESLEVQKDLIAGVENSLENGWIECFQAIHLSNGCVIVKAKVLKPLSFYCSNMWLFKNLLIHR